MLILMLAGYLAACVLLYLRQDQMIFPAPTEYTKATPMDAGIPFEDLHIPVKGEEQIHAWWIPGASSEKVFLVFHGNGYVIEEAVHGEISALHRLGVSLLAVEYRGYGSSSPGATNERRVYEDARTAFAYLMEQRKIPSGDIIFLGRSIGSGAATEMAVEHPEAGGLILISPFTSTMDVGKATWFLRAFPLRLLSHNRFDNLSKMSSVHVPVFIAVGTEDHLTPPVMAQALFQKANEPKWLYLSPGADHDQMMEIGGAALLARIREFLERIR